ncbi:MAG TPA: translation initiation factor [Brumimicrobium sp.]|nr:translation initiation factor [Brumimicrobium sp.]
MSKKNNNRIGVVYSTNTDFNYDEENDEEQETLPNAEQMLRVSIDRKQRKGKEVTLVAGFVGTEEDLKDLAKVLKSTCGVGGTAKDGDILIQGNFRDKIMDRLNSLGYKTKRVGG